MFKTQGFLQSPNTKEAARLLKSKEKEAKRREKMLEASRNSTPNPTGDLSLNLPEINASKNATNMEGSPTNSHHDEPTMDTTNKGVQPNDHESDGTSEGMEGAFPDNTSEPSQSDTDDDENDPAKKGDNVPGDNLEPSQGDTDVVEVDPATKEDNATEGDVDPSRKLFSTPSKGEDGQEEIQPPSGHVAQTEIMPFIMPLPHSKSIAPTSPPTSSEYVRYVDAKNHDKGPPIQTFTYLYSTSEVQGVQHKVLVNSYSKLLPTQALGILWDIEPWKLHVGGDELLHAFKVPESKGEDLSNFHYSPYMSRPHDNLVSLFKEHQSFYLQPPRFNQVPHGWGDDVLTETLWVETVVKALEEVVRTTPIKPRGWLVFELNDPNIRARDLLGSQNHVKFRILRKHVATVQRFTRVAPMVPRWGDNKVSAASMIVQSTPYIALLLAPFCNEGDKLSITPQDHALTAGFPKRRFLDTIEVDDSMPESHLRFDIHPSLLSQEHRLTTRDFYKFLNVCFAPDGHNVDWRTENAVYPFENAVLTHFPRRNPRAPIQNGGFIRCDYKLPTIIADPLLKVVTGSQLFKSGKVFAIDMAEFSNPKSYFVQPTRDTFAGHTGEWSPTEVLLTTLGHIPGGLSNVTLMGSTIRTTTSISILVELSSLAADDNLTQEQTLSRHLFYQAGFLLYRTSNATLVRHTQRTPTWSLFPSKQATLVNQPAKEENAPHLVYLQCPENLSTRDVKVTAALVGKFEKFAFHSSLGQCTILYSVVYTHSDSVALAHALTIEDVIFLPNVELPSRKQELLILDQDINEADRELVAIINAGAKLGSRDAILHLQELERRIIDVVEKLSVHEWQVESPQDDPFSAPTPSPSCFEATENRALRASCLGSKMPDNKYMLSPSKYNPSSGALEREAQLEHMTHVGPPDGLEFVPNFLSAEEEGKLLQWANEFKWDHDVGSRETVQFGYKFDYHSRTITEGRPWPRKEELALLSAKLLPYMKGRLANQMIVNRIHPPNGFGAHKDHDEFDEPIAIVSTGGGVNMVFHHKDGRRFHVVRSQRMSLIVMAGDARHNWYHSIPEGVDDPWDKKLIPRRTRTSYTLRVMKDTSKYDE